MSKHTQDEITAALHAAVELKGADYKYESPNPEGDCVYSDEGAPSCIVGHVVHRLDLEAFQSVVEREERFGTFSADTLPEFTEFDTEERVLKALATAQGVQDAGYSWGDAERAYHYSLKLGHLVPPSELLREGVISR